MVVPDLAEAVTALLPEPALLALLGEQHERREGSMPIDHATLIAALSEFGKADWPTVVPVPELPNLLDLAILCIAAAAYLESMGEIDDATDSINSSDAAAEGSRVKSTILQYLLPALGRHWRQLSLAVRERQSFLTAAWALCQRIDNDAVLGKTGVQFLAMARLVPCFLPWLDQAAPDLNLFRAVAVDIRPDVEAFLLSGLGPNRSPLIQKQTLYLCKQLVKFSSFAHADHDRPCRLLWPASQDSLWQTSWRAFFELYEVLNEPQLHLIEPHLLKLERHFFPFEPIANVNDAAAIGRVVGSVAGALGLEWWTCLLRKAYSNSSVNVRKRVIEGVLAGAFLAHCGNVEALWAMGTPESFLVETLPAMLDHGFLYSHLDLNKVSSPFGEAVGKFYAQCLWSDPSCFGERCRQWLHRVSHLSNNLCILYMLLAVTKYMPAGQHPFLDDGSLRDVAYLASEHLGFHNPRAKHFLRGHLLSVVLAGCDSHQCSFPVVINTLRAITADSGAEHGLALGSDVHGRVRAFLDSVFGADRLESLVVTMGQRTLSGDAVGEEGEEDYAFVCSLMLGRGDQQIDSVSFARCTTPLFQAVTMTCSPQTTQPLRDLARVCRAFLALDGAVERITGGVSLLDQINWNERLFEWMAVLTRACCLDHPHHEYATDVAAGTLLAVDSIADLADIRALTQTFALLCRAVSNFDVSCTSSPPIILWMDIVYIRCVDWLTPLADDSQRPFSHLRDQFLKIAVAGILGSAISVLGSFARGGRSPRHLHLINRRSVINRMLSLKIVTWVDIAGCAHDQSMQGSMSTALLGATWDCLTSMALHSPGSQPDEQLDPAEEEGYSPTEIMLLGLQTIRDGRVRAHGILSVFRCFAAIVGSHQDDITALPLVEAVPVCKQVLEEAESSAWAFSYGVGICSFLLCDAALASGQLTEGLESPLQGFLQWVIHDGLGLKRRGIVPLMARRLCDFLMREERPDRQQDIARWQRTLLDLRLWGPIRSAPEEQLALVSSSQ